MLKITQRHAIASSISIMILSSALMFQNCSAPKSDQANGFSSLSSLSQDQGTSRIGSFLPNIDIKVFMVDPVTDSGNTTLSVTDNYAGLATATTLDEAFDESYLVNEGLIIKKDDAYYGQIANPKQTLMFEPTDPRFLQVNTFFHINRIISSLLTVKAFPASNMGISVNAHCQSGDSAVNNAYLSVAKRELCMGYSVVGSKKAWSGYDADVILHEYGHSLNHNISSTDILGSSLDLKAADESFSDLWAFSQNRQSRIGKWFGTAISKATNSTFGANYSGMRDLGTNSSRYPAGIVGDTHADSVPISSALVQFALSNNLSSSDMHKLLAKTLSYLQSTDNFQDLVLAYLEAARSLNLSETALKSALNSRGFIRKDNVNQIQLNTSQPAFVIDNHVLSSMQSNGNCNGSLDKGETVFILPRFTNNLSEDAGTITMKLTTTSPSTTLQILPGGDVGSLVKLQKSKGYENFLASLQKGSAAYKKYLGTAGFVIAVANNASGTANFKLTISGMNTLDETANVKSFNFSLPIGSQATATSCSDENGVYP